MRELVRILGALLGSVVSILDPDLVVMAADSRRIGEPLFNCLRAEVPRRTIKQFAADKPIVPGKLASHVGLLGTVSEVRQAIR